MTSTSEKEDHPSSASKEWWTQEDDEWLLTEDINSDAGSSTVYTYFSVDSTNMTMSNLPGPGRLLGNLYSYLGKKLEYRIFRTNAKLRGADPEEVGARVRGMALWECSKGDMPPFKNHVMMLSEVSSNDARLLRRCCRAIIYYMMTGDCRTVFSALREIIDLSIKYFPVRDAFNAVRAPDALRILPLLVKQIGSPDAQDIRLIQTLVNKALLCLSDNSVYAACRRSFFLPSWSLELEGIELRLTLDSFLNHRRLRLIAADLIIFFKLELKEPDPRNICDFVHSLPFWTVYKHRKHSLGIEDLAQDETDILLRCCKNLIFYVNLPPSRIKNAGLKAVIELSRQYRSVREAFVRLGAVNGLQRISIETTSDPWHDANQFKEMRDLTEEALFSIQNNEIYDMLNESTLRKSWTPEVEGAILRLELEQYLFHPKLKTIASEHISFIELTTCTFNAFERYAGNVLDPHSGEFGPNDKKGPTLNRVCFVLVKFATGCTSIETRVDACKHIENIIFSHPHSRALLNEVDLSGRLARAVSSIKQTSCKIEVEHSNRYLILSKRIMLCLQDHEVFPKSIAYFQELDNTLLDLIFNYLRSPELFFIGARVLVKIWLKVIFLYDCMLSRVVAFLVSNLEEISNYSEAEFIIVSVLEKILYEQRIEPSKIYGSRYPAKYAELVDALCRPYLRTLYPIAYGTIQEYREQIECTAVLRMVDKLADR